MTIQPEAPETEGRSGLSRRTVIKGAAHAAWAIPAIQIISQAPALAASGDAALSVDSACAGWKAGTQGTTPTFTVTGNVYNTNSKPTTALEVDFTFAFSCDITNVTLGAAAWSAATSTGSTVKIIAGNQLAGTTTSTPTSYPYSVTFKATSSNNKTSATTIDVTAKPGVGAEGKAKQISISKGSTG